MKTYELTQDWQGVLKGTKLYGRYPILASAMGGYYTEENIPKDPNGGDNAFFASAVENNPEIFTLVKNPENGE